MSNVDQFVEFTPTAENYWRAIVLFGLNVASYKFALAKSLLELSEKQGEQIMLEDLAAPFSRHICEHLAQAPKQITAPTSGFLDACMRFNRGDLSEPQLIDTTVRLGFKNVIDAFHVVNRKEVPLRFFIDERQNGAIRITDKFYLMQSIQEAQNLPAEVEARWRLVETAWALKISRNLVGVGYDFETKNLFASDANRRTVITSCRWALNGYQKGKCFYCGRAISVCSGDPHLAEVDHFFPHMLSRVSDAFSTYVDGVWNLVLACETCNRGENGKFARIPDLRLMDRLHRRNEYLISSHHPLRETIIAQTATSAPARRDFLQGKYNQARSLAIHTWYPNDVLPESL